MGVCTPCVLTQGRSIHATVPARSPSRAPPVLIQPLASSGSGHMTTISTPSAYKSVRYTYPMKCYTDCFCHVATAPSPLHLLLTLHLLTWYLPLTRYLPLTLHLPLTLPCAGQDDCAPSVPWGWVLLLLPLHQQPHRSTPMCHTGGQSCCRGPGEMSS